MKTRKIILIVLFLTVINSNSLFSQQRAWSETKEQKTQRMEWWTHDRFGMFIHWGIYAMPARHEWVQFYEKIPAVEYRKYFDRFNPNLYNPEEWAAKAKKAGMK